MPPTLSASDHPSPTQDSTRSRVVAAAHELLVDEGVTAASVQSVARQAGLTTGAIYANFDNKRELLLEVVLGCWSAPPPEARLMRLLTGHDLDEGELGFDELAVLLAAQQSASPAPEYRLLSEVASAAVHDDGIKAVLRACIARLDAEVRRSIDDAKSGGTIAREVSTDALAAVIVDLSLGAITSKSLGRPQLPQSEMLEVIMALTRQTTDQELGQTS
jgi:AcrR family transcriptional regulator